MLRQLSLLAALIVGAVIAGALLAWPVWLLAEHAGNAHFDRVQAMCTVFAGLTLSLVYLYRSAGAFRANLGYTGTPSDVVHLLVPAFLAGILVLAALEFFYLALDVRHLSTQADFSAGALVALVLKSLLAGVLVALFEETLFRGALQGALQRRLGVPAAVLLSSAVFAAAHYLKYPEPPAGSINWFTGIALLPQALRWFRLPGIIPSLLTLFILGVLLALSRLRRGNIYECMGFHAGLVSALKVRTYLTDYTPGTRFDFLVGRYSSDLGWPAIILLAALIMIYLRRKGAAIESE